MKLKTWTRIVFLMAVAGLLSMASICRAQDQQVSFTATLTTEVDQTTVKTVTITNATIINAIVASGSFPGLKAKDCAVVIENSSQQPIDVINTSNNDTLLAQIAVSPNNSTSSGVEFDTKTQLVVTFTLTPFNISLPGVAATQTATLTCKIHEGLKNANARTLLYTFSGGNSFGNVGATYIQGTIKSGPKFFQ